MRHVRKYSDWWNDQGCDVLVHTATLGTFFPFLVRRSARELCERIYQYNEIFSSSRDVKIVFHALSNGGGFPCAEVMHLLAADKKYHVLHSKIKCAVYDSLLATTLTSAFSAVFALSVNIVFKLLFSIFLVLYLVYTYVFGMMDKYVDGFTVLKFPVLLFYSTTDEIVDFKNVESFASILRKKGVQVTTHKYTDSPHVLHFRFHKEDYTAKITDLCKTVGIELQKN